MVIFVIYLLAKQISHLGDFEPPTHPELKNIINCAVLHLKPEKSKRQYEKRYSDFRRLKTGVTRRM
jgi:hypothetical protein